MFETVCLTAKWLKLPELLTDAIVLDVVVSWASRSLYAYLI
jgi:hypothetical protein